MLSHRDFVPSHFLTLVKMTVFAGMLRPMENVSVANRHCKEHGALCPMAGGWSAIRDHFSHQPKTLNPTLA